MEELAELPNTLEEPPPKSSGQQPSLQPAPQPVQQSPVQPLLQPAPQPVQQSQVQPLLQPAQQPVQQSPVQPSLQPAPQPLRRLLPAPSVGGAPPGMLSAEMLQQQQLYALLLAQYQGVSGSSSWHLWQQFLGSTYGTTAPAAAAPAADREEQEKEPKLQAGAEKKGGAPSSLSKSLEEPPPKCPQETLGQTPVTPPVAAPPMAAPPVAAPPVAVPPVAAPPVAAPPVAAPPVPPPAEGNPRASRGQKYYCKFCREQVSVRGNKTSKRPTFVCHHCPSKNYKLRRSNNAYLSKAGQEEVNVYDAVAQQEPNSVLGMKRTWSPEFLEARKRFKEAMATGAATGAGVLSGLPKGHPSGSPTQKGAGEPEGPPEGSETCALELLASATELLAELDSPRASRRARRGWGRPPAAGRA